MEKSKKPENPSAFPFSNQSNTAGMTLRDYAACAVLPKVFQNHWNLSTQEKPIEYKEVAKNAYDIADALLEQREK